MDISCIVGLSGDKLISRSAWEGWWYLPTRRFPRREVNARETTKSLQADSTAERLGRTTSVRTVQLVMPARTLFNIYGKCKKITYFMTIIWLGFFYIDYNLWVSHIPHGCIVGTRRPGSSRSIHILAWRTRSPKVFLLLSFLFFLRQIK